MVQLRQDNALGTLWNMVGFQTKLKHGEQVRVFRTIPGLENAQFARLGGLHRNTFINSPRLLDGQLRLKSRPHLRFAGQMTGVEGYVESAAIGLLAGRFAAAEMAGRAQNPPPPTTALGALLSHITGGADASHFQPMNVNFGLFPPLPAGGKTGAKTANRRSAPARSTIWRLAGCGNSKRLNSLRRAFFPKYDDFDRSAKPANIPRVVKQSCLRNRPWIFLSNFPSTISKPPTR